MIPFAKTKVRLNLMHRPGGIYLENKTGGQIRYEEE